MTTTTDYRIDGMTDYELEIVARYEHAINGLVDSFDCVDGYHFSRRSPETFTEAEETEINRATVAALPGMLHTWWEHLDNLDGDGFDYCGNPKTKAFASYFATEVDRWFTARDGLLDAIAVHHGYNVLRPHHDDGQIESSSRPIGHVGFTATTGLG